MVQAARIANARQIIAVDPIAERRELAGRFGATDTVDPDAGDPVEQVKALTQGRGADYTMEAATLASVFPQTIRAARRAGTVVLTSVERGNAEVTVPQLSMSVEGRAILGAQNGNVRMRRDLPRFIRMMEDGWLDPKPIITERYPLDRIDDALHASAEKRDLSGVIVPSLAA
jgi:Zn-dependent alcohol dehydrogenase